MGAEAEGGIGGGGVRGGAGGGFISWMGEWGVRFPWVCVRLREGEEVPKPAPAVAPLP